MSKKQTGGDHLFQDLQERAKELQCLYRVREILNSEGIKISDAFTQLAEVIPQGWRYPEICRARITYRDEIFRTQGFTVTDWLQEAKIELNGKNLGTIEVVYIKSSPGWLDSPFLPEEQFLLNSIADKVENFLFQKELQATVEHWERAEQEISARMQPEWMVTLDLIEKMDSSLFSKISRRMLNHLCWIGIEEAQTFLEQMGARLAGEGSAGPKADENYPSHKVDLLAQKNFSKEIFDIAARYFSEDEILEDIKRWMREDKINFLVQVLEKTDTSLAEISGAVSRYHHLSRSSAIEISSYARSNINSLFMQRLFTEQLEYIRQARKFLDLDDFYKVLQHTIYPNNSHGKLGGKSAGLFIAEQLLKKTQAGIKTPKTWYITSDYSMDFIYYNNLEEAMEQKYKDIEEIRTDYPNLIQIFRNSNFPFDFINGISRALEDFGDSPIVVRSSSLLEDRYGTAFAGKYTSIFLANQGTKEENLDALMDAIARIYASIFGPDPIEYRKDHGLLEYHEEMAIIIQEVIGTRAGDYYFPSFAGVGFSENDFRWSPRLKREEGLLRLVPGLGTRAVDRTGDDYPILISPSQPHIRVNASPEEAARYAPREMDVINLKENCFETVGVRKLLRELGRTFPDAEKLVSVYEFNQTISRSRFQIDFEKDDLIITMNSLIADGEIISRLKYILTTLQEQMGIPVDIEFVYTGEQLYLLQCRPQASAAEVLAPGIPRQVSGKNVLFTARKYINNAQIYNITHVVYVDPEAYSRADNLEKLERIGQAVGKLNSHLPRRRFILMGPGRWGSRGDIKLGVKVGYSDISNSAMLIEIARQKGSYVPELSFGTHFFQDLVEASIRYLPLYPDEPGNLLQEEFFLSSHNRLPEILPEYRDLADTVFVTDIPKETGGKVLNVIMNSDAGKAMGFLSKPGVPDGGGTP